MEKTKNKPTIKKKPMRPKKGGYWMPYIGNEWQTGTMGCIVMIAEWPRPTKTTLEQRNSYEQAGTKPQSLSRH
jgi:hypothetical protein